MRIFTNLAEHNWSDLCPAKPCPLTKGWYACQWLDTVDMHMYATFGLIIPCGSRVMNILLTAYARTDGQTDSHSGYSAHNLRFVQLVKIIWIVAYYCRANQE